MNWTKWIASASCWLIGGVGFADTRTDPESAAAMLKNQGKQFDQAQIVRVTNNVFTAVGYHGATTSMIVGDDGVVIVDTLMGPTSAQNAFDALRQYSDKPVKAIIYTHSHGDHTGGARVFAGDDAPDVYATESFGATVTEMGDLQPIVRKRGIRQFGRTLPPEEATNRGLAPANTIDHDRGEGFLPPTVRVSGEAYRTNVAGVEIEMYAAPGETDDALFVWLPEEKVLFAGDNFYQAFPNLYAIRGTSYRDVRKWSDSLAQMAAFNPEHLVGGHTLPISGAEAVQALIDYGVAIGSIYDQTIAGINQGKTPDVIAHEVRLPDDIRDKSYLVEFYGTVAHSTRAVFAGLLGWFDGNPTTLNRLHPREEAAHVARLAGGAEKLEKQMLSALESEEYQWAMQLADHLKWLEEDYLEIARKTKVDALRALAALEFNAPNRNYYLTYARELESGALTGVWF